MLQEENRKSGHTRHALSKNNSFFRYCQLRWANGSCKINNPYGFGNLFLPRTQLNKYSTLPTPQATNIHLRLVLSNDDGCGNISVSYQNGKLHNVNTYVVFTY